MASVKLVGFARQFSTSAVRAKLVQPPVQVFGLEGNYATALYSAASKQNKLDVIEKDLVSLGGLLKKDTKFADFLLDPTRNKKVKGDVVKSVVQKMKYTDLTANLLLTLSENGRMNKLDAVLKKFGEIMSAHKGEVLCIVTTAKALDDATYKELDTVLKSFVKKGQVMTITKRIDPSIIGGMIVSIGDKYVDMSLQSKINIYTDVIRKA